MHKPAWMTVEQYVEALEAFMGAVAREVKCLPSFADPKPEDGNAHIMRKLRELTANATALPPQRSGGRQQQIVGNFGDGSCE